MKKSTVKVTEEVFVIPELEELAKKYVPKQVFWTDYEKALLVQYAGRVNIKDLAKYLPIRTLDAIKAECKKLGLSWGYRKVDDNDENK